MEPLARRKTGGRYPLLVENQRIDQAVEAMRLNPGNPYRAATWLKEQLGVGRRAATNLLAIARARIVCACKTDMESAFGELFLDIREKMKLCADDASWGAYARIAGVAVQMVEAYQILPIAADDDDDDGGDVIFRIVDSVVVPDVQ